MSTYTATELAHSEDVGRVSGMGEPLTCYHANGARNAAEGKGIPRYSGKGCTREHVTIKTALTYPAAIQALFAGDHYAAYIQRDLARKLALGIDRTHDSLGALYAGNDGD